MSWTTNVPDSEMTASIQWAIVAFDLSGASKHLLLGEGSNQRYVVVSGPWSPTEYLVPDTSQTKDGCQIRWFTRRAKAAEAWNAAFLPHCGDPDLAQNRLVAQEIAKGLEVGWWRDRPIEWRRP